MFTIFKEDDMAVSMTEVRKLKIGDSVFVEAEVVGMIRNNSRPEDILIMAEIGSRNSDGHLDGKEIIYLDNVDISKAIQWT